MIELPIVRDLILILESEHDQIKEEENQYFADLIRRYYPTKKVCREKIKSDNSKDPYDFSIWLMLDNRMAVAQYGNGRYLWNRHNLFVNRALLLPENKELFWEKNKELERVLSANKGCPVRLCDTDSFSGETFRRLVAHICSREDGLGSRFFNQRCLFNYQTDKTIYEIFDARDFFYNKYIVDAYRGGKAIIDGDKIDYKPYWALPKEEGCDLMSMKPDLWNWFVADCIHMNQLFGRDI